MDSNKTDDQVTNSMDLSLYLEASLSPAGQIPRLSWNQNK
jgi:hypothetical protein